MRIEDGLINQLYHMGYKQLNINISGVSLLYLAVETKAYIVLFFRAVYGTELSVEEYRRLINGIKAKFSESGYTQIHLLGLIFTAKPDMAKQFCLEEEDHWLIDLVDRRLIIYENQAPDYMGLRNVIEGMLADGNIITDPRFYGRDAGGGAYTRPSEASSFKDMITPVNMTFIAINILIYLLVHYTGMLGQTEQVMDAGALSWFDVEHGQYYRIITSMFLHYDFSHIFNNMLVLFFLGDKVEHITGKYKYLIIYLGSGIIAGVTSLSYNMIKDNAVISVGASGAIFGLVGAMVYILIANKGRINNMRSSQILLFAFFSLYGGITNANVDNAAHIGGFLAGGLLAVLLYRKPKRNST